MKRFPSQAQENETISILLCLCHTCKPGRRKHKHKRKERKHVRHVGFKSRAKRQPGFDCAKIFMLLCLRMSPYAYAYRTCKHPCAYACVVRVNQALSLSSSIANEVFVTCKSQPCFADFDFIFVILAKICLYQVTGDIVMLD